MGWWVYLQCPCCGRSYALEEAHMEGGVLNLSGNWETCMSVTYNYSKHFTEGLGFGFRDLEGKTAKETTESLKKAVEFLGTDRSHDYWEATCGNAGHILSIMLEWAKIFPNGVWHIS